MKINLHEAILYKLRWKNINCNNFPVISMEQKTRSLVYLILFLFVFLTTRVLYAQPGSQKKEEENLNVFRQWIKWNNPGSMSLNHLTRQAEVYYHTRDKQ